MTDMRCPMCGKENPTGLETCQFCQARLKPLVSSSTDNGASDQSDKSNEENTNGNENGVRVDWLQSFRPTDTTDNLSEGKSPDWLKDLRDQSIDESTYRAFIDREESEEPDFDETELHTEFPKWLIDHGKPEGIRKEVGDKDKNLHEQFEFNKQAESKEDMEQAPEPEADWLQIARLSYGENNLQEIPDQVSAEDDWESDNLETIPLDEVEGEGVDLPKWLVVDKEQEKEPELWEQSDDDKVHETSAFLSVNENVPLIYEDGMGDEIPEWLAKRDKQTPVGETDSKDSIHEDIQSSQSFITKEEEIEIDIKASSTEFTFSGIEESEQDQEFDITASDIEGSFIHRSLASSEKNQLFHKEVSPFGDDFSELIDESKRIELITGEHIDDNLDWLDAEKPPPGVKTLAAATLPEDTDQVSKDRDLVKEESVDAFVETLPDGSKATLSEENVDEHREEIRPSETEGISKAELPDWLEAIRPIATVGIAESLSQLDDDTRVEGAGPLSGLKGVLRAEPDVSRTQKPPVYSMKLQVSDEQLSRADILTQLLHSESENPPIPERSIVTAQNIQRIIIASVLIITIMSAMILGMPQVKSPNFNPETFASNQIVGDLAGGDPVLIAVDYEPGVSAEMDAITSAVLDHLMVKGTFIVFVSTLATGPLQAERVVEQVNRIGSHDYAPQSQYINMGFLPGGSAGLLGLVQNPRLILPTDAQGNSVWNNPDMEKISSLKDFSLVIVATENPETARAWIEQVQPDLGDTPMVFLASMQAEPLVRPYYDANPRQIQGLVSGLVSGSAYQSLTGRSGRALEYWAPFNLGVVVSVILIILGGLVNVLMHRVSKNKEDSKGGLSQ